MTEKHRRGFGLPFFAACCVASAAMAQDAADNLSLRTERSLDFIADEGTWIALDISPDGRTIMFDLLGDIYALGAEGGEARPVLQGMAFETHPVFSADGGKFAFISDRSGSANLWIANADGSGL
ncbi:MAG: PD40 domain-containing protein, partial [Oricola sp.]|nr:PD40 domain-containing protein [Oricola sp.]